MMYVRERHGTVASRSIWLAEKESFTGECLSQKGISIYIDMQWLEDTIFIMACCGTSSA
jgi:hypothetical protein